MSVPPAARSWLDPAHPPAQRARALLARMTQEEKLAQLVSVWLNEHDEDQARFASGTFVADLAQAHPHGIGGLTRPYGSGPTAPPDAARQVSAVQRHLVEHTRLGIPALVHEECLTGLMVPGATILPSPLAWGATFSPDDVEAAAAAVGGHLASLGVHLGLAPVLDVARDHRYGRVEECISEHPGVVADLGAAYVRGLQSAPGVAACAKHFVGHAAPEAGHNTAPVHCGRRELTDVHLPPFAAAVEAGVLAVMSAYHDLDAAPVSATPALLGDLLRARWGFDGVVVSDYWALNFLITRHRVAATAEESAALALAAGVDLELPKPDHYPHLAAALDAGLVTEALIDAAVLRILALKFRLGLFERPYPPAPDADLDPPTARAAARRLAERSVTLLANDGVLPLAGVRRLAVVGPWADDPRVLVGNYSWPNHVGYRYGNRFAAGPHVPTFVEALRERASRDGVEVTTGSTLAQAVAAAARADVAVVVVGDRPGHFGTGTVGEGTDRDDLRLPGDQDDLVRAVVATGVPTVVLVTAGRGLDLGACEAAAAVLVVWFGGEEGAPAVARVVFGDVNPSGRCPITFGRGAGQQPIHHASRQLARQHYLEQTTRPRYAFGHGLGYSTFEYSDVRLSSPTIAAQGGSVELSCTVRNTGEADGEDVVQLYVRDHAGQVARPALELLGYARVRVAAGGRARVCFDLPAAAFAYAGRDERVIDPGPVTIWVAASSADLRIAVELTISGSVTACPLPRLGHVRARVVQGNELRPQRRSPGVEVVQRV